MDIVFVILNYNLFDEVCNCIDSICANIDTDSFRIVVVDNASTNGVGKMLVDKYADSDKVEIIRNEENAGFARGNNIGIDAALAYAPNYIACINNDILLEQKDFYSALNRKYKETHAALIGPEIRKPSGKLQHFHRHLRPLEEYKKDYLEICDDDDLTSVQLMKRKVKKSKLYALIKGTINKKVTVVQKAESPEEALEKARNEVVEEEMDVVLHGSCLILTRAFFEAGLKGFDPRTFLYREEQLLYLEVMRKGLRTLITPELKIIHIGNVATNTVNDNDDKKKSEFRRKHEARSLKILIEELEKQSGGK